MRCPLNHPELIPEYNRIIPSECALPPLQNTQVLIPHFKETILVSEEEVEAGGEETPTSGGPTPGAQ